MSYASNIPKFYIYKFLSSFFFIGPIVILFYLSYISYAQFGIVIAIGLAVSMLFEVPSGVLADMWGRKKTVVLGLFLCALEMFIIGLGQSFSAFIIASIVGGIAWAFISGADTALLYDSLKHIKREHESKIIYGKVRAIRYWAIVLAALLGAPLYVYLDYLPFVLNGVMLLLTALLFMSVKETPIHRSTSSLSHQYAHIKDSIAYIWNNTALLWFIGFASLGGVGIWIFHDMIRSAYYESIGFPIAILGVLTAIITGVRSLFSLYAHKVEAYVGINNSILLILFLQVPLFFLMAYFYTQIAFIFVLCLYCIWSFQEVLSEVYSHEHMNSKQRATLVSIQSFFVSCAVLLGSILTGYIIEWYSIQIMLYMLSGMTLLIGVVLWFTKNI